MEWISKKQTSTNMLKRVGREKRVLRVMSLLNVTFSELVASVPRLEVQIVMCLLGAFV